MTQPVLHDFLIPLLQWWGVLLAISVAFAPLSAALFPKTYDRGYAAGKALGFATVAYAAWLAGTLKLGGMAVPVVIGTALCALAGGLLLRHHARPALRVAIFEELGFLLLLLVWGALRTGRPDLHETERPMDFAILNAALRAEALPPEDPWLAGLTINYYYFGHHAFALLTRLANVAPEIGYNLALATVVALVMLLSFALVAHLLSRGESGFDRASAVGGTLAALLLGCAGSLHVPIYGVVIPWLARAGLIEGPVKAYAFTDGTRYIGFNPPTLDKTITEFPAYSFVLGDLHAHMMSLVFGLALLHVACGLAGDRRGSGTTSRTLLAAFASLLLAIQIMTNSWSFPIHGGVVGLALALGAVPAGIVRNAWRCAGEAAAIVGIAVLLAAPFLLKFEPIGQGLGWVETRTPLWQLAVVYGYQLALLAWFAVTRLRVRPNPESVAADRFILLLVVIALGCLAVPELVYLRDIYGQEWRRANTMFKFGYEGFVLLTLVAAYSAACLARTSPPGKAGEMRMLAVGVVCGGPLLFTYYAFTQYFSWNSLSAMTLDGLAFMRAREADDYAVVAWLRTNATRETRILEADGLSYTRAARISTATGVPTVLGWFTHEWLWRGGTAELEKRQREIKVVYQDGTCEEAAQILDHYGVKYVVVSRQERDKFKGMDLGRLEGFAETAFRAGDAVLMRVRNAGARCPS